MATDLKKQLEALEANRIDTKRLKEEKLVIVRDIITDLISEIKVIKDNQLLQPKTRKELIDIIKTQNGVSGSPIFGIVARYYELNIKLDYSSISLSLFSDIIKFVESGLISKSLVAKSSNDVLRVEINRIKKELKENK